MDQDTGNKAAILVRAASDSSGREVLAGSKEDKQKICDALSESDAVSPVEFMKAASQGKLEIMDQYLADGGDPDVHDERTALHRASMEGHTAVVEVLLEKGAKINFKDRLGSGAMHWACRGGSLDVIKSLTDHGADLNVKDKLSSTPLHVATRTGNAAIVEYLLACGAKINHRDRFPSSLAQTLTSLSPEKWQSQANRETRSVQCVVGRVPHISAHLKHCPEPSSLDVSSTMSHSQMTDLLTLCRRESTLILRPSSIGRYPKQEGDTPLHDAVRLNRFRIVKMLIGAGADMKVQNNEGLTAVQQIKQWQLDIMETLDQPPEPGSVPAENSNREEGRNPRLK